MRLLAALALAALCGAVAAQPLKVGTKRFTESYILGEILARVAPGQLKPGLGNTGIVFAALKAGAIDVYPEYTGTIAKEILKLDGEPGLVALNHALAPHGLAVGVPLGFSNGYALAMREDRAEKLGIRTLSDLARHPRLKLGLSQEFLARKDGWPGLKAAYRLSIAPTGLDHGLAYEALAAGDIDVMDVYTTDAKILGYRMRALEDDRRYFPRYEAVLLYRVDAPARFPREFESLQKLEGRIDETAMIRMNAAAELEGKVFSQAAALFFGEEAGTGRSFLGLLFGPDFWRVTGEHLLLVFASLAASVVVGVPLGIVAAKLPRAAQPVLATVGVIQTIPALALLAFLIAAVGTIGVVPALIALFLYALLPIVRNTHSGIVQGARGLVQAGKALGMRAGQILRQIELPLALPSILAGVKTSAVINVGTATIAAFIGAGGYGERIAAGLALNDKATLLAGAIPAAALALLVQGAFELAERRFGWIKFPR
ncbi:MAG: osmoprotectant transport system substrate-binding protein opuBD [Betaproteobacteria bacterium]|nr:osmoprotectant transport system substrate-binding protein opuBD [Betaproteobacteria bacterium]